MRIPPIGFKPIYRWKVYDKRKPWPWLSFSRKSEPVGEKNLGFSFIWGILSSGVKTYVKESTL